MRTSRTFWILAFVVGLVALIAAACGDGDGDGDEATATPKGAEPTATEPYDVANVPGVTETEIKLGTHQPLSESVAVVYAKISSITEAYFDFINTTKGGVHGRTITLLSEDDRYLPDDTNTVVRKLVEQDNVFAILNGLGTATHLAVVDYLLNLGVPDMYMSTGAIEWVKDPAARPNIFGAIPNYYAEGMLLGKYITDTYPAGTKLGVLFQADEFGEDGLVGIKLGLGDGVEIVAEESYEPVDIDVDSQIDRLRSAGAEVVVMYTLPQQTAGAITHARLEIDWDVDFVMSGVSANEVTLLVAGEGNPMVGTVSAGIFRQVHETDDPGVAAHLQFLQDYAGVEIGADGCDPRDCNYLTIYGQYIAELMVETLERAGPELTREGLIAAAESITDFQCSVCLFSINLSATDHDPAQAGIMSRVDADGRWVNFGEIFSWEGVLPDDLTLDDLETLASPYE